MLDCFTLFLLSVFIFSGSISPILVEIISMNGGAEPTTMLILLPSCIGMSATILLNLSAIRKGTIQWKYLLLVTFTELISSILTFHGLTDAGSAIFTVAYCSVTIFTAFFASIFLGRKLCMMQWMGIFTVTFGLTIVIIGSEHEGTKVTYGIVLILLGALLHSLSYVISEYLLIVSDDPIAPEYLCTLLGLLSGSINIIWQIIYTIPRFDVLVTDKILQHHGNAQVVSVVYLLLIWIAFTNSASFYTIIGRFGSASTGVLKGLQAVATFVTSHYSFCGIQKSQCFTVTKGVSLVVVLTGVLMYSIYNDETSDDYPYLTELQRMDPEEGCQIVMFKDTSSDYTTAIVPSKDVRQIHVVTSQPYQLYDAYAYRQAGSVSSLVV